MANINEYYAIQNLTGLGYKLFCVVRLMTREGKADQDGWVKLSYNAIANKMNTSRSNIVRVVSDVEKFPELIEVSRGLTGSGSNRFRVNKDLL